MKTIEITSKSIYSGIQWCINKISKITQSHNHVWSWPKRTKIWFIKTRDMILVSKSSYSSQENPWCIYKNPEIMHSLIHAITKLHKYVPFWPEIGYIKARDLILQCLKLSAGTKESNSASLIILKSYADKIMGHFYLIE